MDFDVDASFRCVVEGAECATYMMCWTVGAWECCDELLG